MFRICADVRRGRDGDGLGVSVPRRDRVTVTERTSPELVPVEHRADISSSSSGLASPTVVAPRAGGRRGATGSPSTSTVSWPVYAAAAHRAVPLCPAYVLIKSALDEDGRRVGHCSPRRNIPGPRSSWRPLVFGPSSIPGNPPFARAAPSAVLLPRSPTPAAGPSDRPSSGPSPRPAALMRTQGRHRICCSLRRELQPALTRDPGGARRVEDCVR